MSRSTGCKGSYCFMNIIASNKPSLMQCTQSYFQPYKRKRRFRQSLNERRETGAPFRMTADDISNANKLCEYLIT